MKKVLLSLAFCPLLLCTNLCDANYALLQDYPDSWEVVKETDEYLIVRIKSDLNAEVKSEDGPYKVSYQAGERRVFLKSRLFRASLKSNPSYKVKQTIEIVVPEKENNISEET